MKILNKYRFVRGASSGGGAPTPKLVPPPANQNLLKSLSISHSVDALCEGPIYGLVDQFGKKIYGLDMFKGIYLNGMPAMNNKGEYNFRNLLMEINLGTENQKPLANFGQVYIFRPANFKLLGKINPNETDQRAGGDFTSWAKQSSGEGGWPNKAQDPFVYVHHIRNKDVRRLELAFLIEQLYDTVSEGTGPGEAGKMGMNKAATVELFLKWGVEGSSKFSSRTIKIQGVALGPYAYMIGDDFGLSVKSGDNPATFQPTVTSSRSLPDLATSRTINPESSSIRRTVYQTPQ